ncbi:hypothetical protein ACSNOG_14045, partial [Streptomyces sp. URMC 124]
MPPVGGNASPVGDSAAATQYLPPVRGNASPGGVSSPSSGGPVPPPPLGLGGGPAVQGERPPPSEFDGLFRASADAAASSAAARQAGRGPVAGAAGGPGAA